MQESPQWRKISGNKPELKLVFVIYKLDGLSPVQLDRQRPRVSIFNIIMYNIMTTMHSTTVDEYVRGLEI